MGEKNKERDWVFGKYSSRDERGHHEAPKTSVDNDIKSLQGLIEQLRAQISRCSQRGEDVSKLKNKLSQLENTLRSKLYE